MNLLENNGKLGVIPFKRRCFSCLARAFHAIKFYPGDALTRNEKGKTIREQKKQKDKKIKGNEKDKTTD
jgi:hypothetical protein